MWPAFNSFVVLLPCGKKGADGSPVGEGRVPLRLGEKRRRRERRRPSLCIPLFVCSKNFFFFAILEIIFLV